MTAPAFRTSCRWFWLAVWLPIFVGALPAVCAREELRGLWVDTFHPGLRTDAEIRQLVADARTARINALFVEVRRRGDAFYDSRFEPRAEELAPGFDPLRRLLELAHDRSAGPRLEIHAWVVAYNIWNSASISPPQPDHPFRRHPDWLTRNAAGATWDGRNYAFDPGHPAVQTHTFNVVMDLVRRYDLDGLHWDYIRYSGREWGYHPVAIDRFNSRAGRTGRPSPSDPAWLQFRRDQVTALVRKVTLCSLAEKPSLRISAATIGFAPGITGTSQWPSSSAYSDVLQDWRAWLEEGILDLSVPMLYFRQADHADAFAAWNTFVKDHQYARRGAIGVGCYLNGVSNSLAQIRMARRPSPSGNLAAGVVLYSYAFMATNATRAEFLGALTRPTRPDANAGQPPVFADTATVPGVPWKLGSSSGNVMGVIRNAVTEAGLDGVAVQFEGPVRRSLPTDATGFFGTLNLPPGDYRVQAAAAGFEGAAADCTITAAGFARIDFNLSPTRSPVAGSSPSGPGSSASTKGFQP